MKKVLLVLLATALAVLSAAGPASAKDRKPAITAEPIEVKRSLFGGTESRLSDFSWLSSDCTAPIAVVRIVKPPSNGDVRFEETKSAITASKSALQKLCHGKPIDAVRLFYKAHENFVGIDKFVLDVDTKVGFVKRYTYVVDVTLNPAAGAAQDSITQASKAAVVQGVSETVINREVFTGNESRIAAMNYVNADCTSGPVPNLRIVTAPQNGEYHLEEITVPVDRKAGDPRAACNGKPVATVGVLYKSKTEFTGQDNIVIDVDFKAGSVRRFNYNITVR